MLHRDLIIREIQQAVRVLMHVLAQVLKLKSQERYEAAIQQINEALGGLELAPRPIAELTSDQVVDLCRTERGFSVDLALAIADLLREEADILLLDGKAAEARASAAKAHALYEEALATKGAALPMDIGKRIDALEEMIEDADEMSAGTNDA